MQDTEFCIYHTFIEHLSFPLTQPKTISFTDIFKRLIPEIPYFIYPLMYLLGLIIIVKGRYKNTFYSSGIACNFSCY